MQLSTGPPLLFAIGVRILLNYITPDHVPSTPDYLLLGIWQGVLLYHALKHLSWLVYPVGIGITAKLLIDFIDTADTSRCACTLLGVALGVLFTDILAQLFEHGRYAEVEPAPSHGRESHEPPRRLRLVSFDKATSGAERERERQRRRRSASPSRARARALAASPAPTNHTTLTSYTVDSLPSSIDPHNRLSPVEREVAVLRARASLADSERRRFKEERKWALSQGNKARASQLAWQVKRYTALMESFHREADNKVVDAARAAQAQAQAQSAARPQPQAGPSRQINAVAGPSRITQDQVGPSRVANGAPLVSVTVGGPSRTRKRSGTSGALKPAIYIHDRQ